MMRLLSFFLMALLSLAAFSIPATAQTFPPLGGRVVDEANLLSPAQEAQIAAQSLEVEQASARQFVVATIPDLQGYPIEDYGYRLGRAWKIGQGEANNGILLIVAPKERKVRIEVGYGLEPIMTDALSSVIIRDTILPRFKAGDMAGGILAGASAIAEQMKLPLEAAEARAKKSRPAAGSARRSGSGGAIVVFVILILLFFVLPRLFARAGGRRYRSRGVAGAVGEVLLWTAINSLSNGRGSGGSGWSDSGGGGWGGGGGGGFSGGGGSFGGGGASGGW